MISQFSVIYCTASYNLELSPKPSNTLRDKINVLPTSSSQRVLYVTKPRFFPFYLWPSHFVLGPEIEMEKTRSITYPTDFHVYFLSSFLLYSNYVDSVLNSNVQQGFIQLSSSFVLQINSLTIFCKYSGNPLYGHPLNTDNPILRTVSFSPTKSSYFF